MKMDTKGIVGAEDKTVSGGRLFMVEYSEVDGDDWNANGSCVAGKMIYLMIY